MKGIYFSFTCYLSITNHSHTLCVVDFCSIVCSILKTLNSCLNTSCIRVIFLKSDFWFRKITTWPFIEKNHKSFEIIVWIAARAVALRITDAVIADGQVPGSCGSACVLAECGSCQPDLTRGAGEKFWL